MVDLIKIEDLFDINYGNGLELINLEQCKSTDFNAIPFVSRTEKNNGVSAFVCELLDTEPNPGHTLSVALGGSVLSTFYQPMPFYTGFHVFVLSPKIPLTDVEMLIYSKYISSNKYKYSYGRQANKTLKDILIPKYISDTLISYLLGLKNKMESTLKQSPIIPNVVELNTTQWDLFPLSSLFIITGSRTTSKQELEEIGKGSYPYVTTQATNNAVENFYGEFTEEGNILAVDSAVVGHCSYQAFRFSASDHVEKLIPKFKMNEYIAMFFVTILNLEKYRYNYGRKASQTRMEQVFIKLPSKNNQPDFEFMENYIKSIRYSKALQLFHEI